MSFKTPVFEALYHQHGPALLRYLHAYFADPGTAEDLLHETFVQALRCSHQLATVESHRAWLFGIARHMALSALRRQRLTQPLTAELEAPRPSEADSRMEEVNRCILDLPPPLRETLQLRLRDDLAYEEIAAVLDIPVGTVRSRLHHALR